MIRKKHKPRCAQCGINYEWSSHRHILVDAPNPVQNRWPLYNLCSYTCLAVWAANRMEHSENV
jgi:hypothetical protein